MSYFVNKETGDLNVVRIIRWVATVFIVVVLISSSLGTVGAGERGIKTRFSAVTGQVVGQGLYFKLPFIERVVIMDVQIQKEQVEASAASQDLQTVSSVVALNFHVDPAQVGNIYQNVGEEYKVRIIDPIVQESVKASTARFTAEQLITKREEVRETIKNHITEKLQGTGLVVDSFNIVNFDFSKSFNDAIESKVTAEQNALAAKNKLEQVKYEAQQAIEEARGKAEALRVESAAIASNPSIVQLRAIEKWDGKMPQVTGGNMPLINLK